MNKKSFQFKWRKKKNKVKCNILINFPNENEFIVEMNGDTDFYIFNKLRSGFESFNFIKDT